jgi:hypothetical protein
MRLTKRVGMLLLAAWLLLMGLNAIVDLKFQGMNIVLGALAIAAAMFIAVDR